MKRYPDLGLDWILEDEENTPARREVNRYETDTYSPKSRQSTPVYNASELNREQRPVGRDVQTNVAKPEAPEETEKSIERILIFYTDGTFREYTPGR
ncbi:hypothetical protein [Telluribacter sp. SYSU D00476]|uniref:hypothetical protein n=1 Tax=Telluribacter sp. SYSU D00476 TaxID=2811430 RepID=UPI0038F72089